MANLQTCTVFIIVSLCILILFLHQQNLQLREQSLHSHKALEKTNYLLEFYQNSNTKCSSQLATEQSSRAQEANDLKNQLEETTKYYHAREWALNKTLLVAQETIAELETEYNKLSSEGINYTSCLEAVHGCIANLSNLKVTEKLAS
eukprot:TRINITY_DN9655_c0_g1_i1.p1 TRINITY_DN9655_c0_g1~~TRINITY_DN9655_c0_g1_i1.p1  ORF type:complete len:147 (-),score=17.17 TRINITY_DN9655_c0_g1_i1:147-587(-)